ncbi:MAG: hypothetical protein ACO20H_05960 [Bacteriovoracaceae bacterium]
MKIEDGVRHYPTKNDYLSAKTGGDAALKKDPIHDKVELSSVDKEEVKKEVKKAGEKVQDLASKTGNIPIGAAVDLLSGVKSVAFNSIPSIPVMKTSEIKVDPPAPEIEDKPAIFFITGLGMAQISSRQGGLEEMAKHVPEAQEFDWGQKEEILEIIKKTPEHRAVVLVGHSLGGDTAVEISNKLNTIEYGYRKVDLLVTLDSIGLNNDIIPNNVRKNMNFIGGNDLILNDGPNIARDTKFTEVINELVPSSHRGMDESNDIQQKIYQEISDVLGDKEQFNEMADKAYEEFRVAGQRIVDIVKRD